jgi:hypothetical protein
VEFSSQHQIRHHLTCAFFCLLHVHCSVPVSSIVSLSLLYFTMVESAAAAAPSAAAEPPPPAAAAASSSSSLSAVSSDEEEAARLVARMLAGATAGPLGATNWQERDAALEDCCARLDPSADEMEQQAMLV